MLRTRLRCSRTGPEHTWRPGRDGDGEVAENTDDGENIGDAFEATDAGDLLTFELGGADAASFGLTDPTTGTNSVYLQTKAELDFETKSEYMVTLTATDPTGASDMITVTVMVTDGTTGAVVGIDVDGDVRENGEDPVVTFSATDQDGDDITWKLGRTESTTDFELRDRQRRADLQEVARLRESYGQR